jgi:hypothetical protein
MARGRHAPSIALWVIEFERGRHYVVVGPAVCDQPNVPLLDIATRVQRDRHARDPIYQTPTWTDPRKQAAPADPQDPRAIGMPLDLRREALRVVSVFDILDDWSLSDLLRASRYVAVQGDWRALGAKLSLQRAERRDAFHLRRYPHLVGVYLGDAPQWGEYTFIGPSADSFPSIPLADLLALLRSDLRQTQERAAETVGCAHEVRHVYFGDEPPTRSSSSSSGALVRQQRCAPGVQPRESWGRYLCRVGCCCLGGGRAGAHAPDSRVVGTG